LVPYPAGIPGADLAFTVFLDHLAAGVIRFTRLHPSGKPRNFPWQYLVCGKHSRKKKRLVDHLAYTHYLPIRALHGLLQH
jgi:hypothetical protein